MNIVMYHYVRPKNPKNGKLRYLTLDQFQNQLDYFEKNLGFLSQEEFIYNLKNKIISEKVLLTFDDGLIDHYTHVFPVLKERNIKGLFFIPTAILNQTRLLNVHKIHYLLVKRNPRLLFKIAFEIINEKQLKIATIVDKEAYKYSKHEEFELKLKALFNYQLDYDSSNIVTDQLLNYFGLNHDFSIELYMNKNHIKEMYENDQIFGSHTVNHKILSTLDFENQILEIKNSINVLSKFIHNEFKTISYPFGYKFTYNSDTIKVLKKLNVDYGFVFDNKKNSSFNKYEISRIDCNRFINTK